MSRLKLRPFIIDDTTKQAIERIKSYAETHVYSMDDLLDIKNNEKDSIIAGDQEGFTCLLPFGYKVVFSMEDQPAGMVRHLSVSVDTEGKMPSQLVVSQIMKLIGFENSLTNLAKEGYIHIEEIGENHHAINVLEKIKQ